ncbi:hypothetical protein GMO_16120 [Gluconobacter morbifer G707]|uniref:Uncharacterized protein n=1 Tax=Gluconobacter morbifer G707 TaxID=1088869 RepID=G6XJN3_9PROT|nr:hypothetical protein GMO_16120 [Gluconobacter morbifer G707]
MHAFQQLAAPREIATACAPLFMREAARLRERADGITQQDLPQTCSACEVAARIVGKQIGKLAYTIEHDPSALKRAAGLCQPHFERVLEQISDPERKTLVLYQQAAILERLADDMNGFALKQDASRSDAMTQSERYAARSGLDLWSGLANAWISQPIVSNVVRIKDNLEKSHSEDDGSCEADG